MKRVLVTGFSPFGGESTNPSADVALALDGQVIEGRTVVSVVLPCVFDEAIETLKKALKKTKPELVICLGQAGGRAAITVERVAINVDDARIPDNEGVSPIDRPIVKRGPVGYWSSLPIKSIVLALRESGLPAEVSQTAGTFVCNHVFYGLMHLLRKKKGVRGGFIHIPYAPEQAARIKPVAPSLSVADTTRAIALAIATALTTKRDARTAGGATH